jgi:hypothetical protein
MAEPTGPSVMVEDGAIVMNNPNGDVTFKVRRDATMEREVTETVKVSELQAKLSQLKQDVVALQASLTNRNDTHTTVDMALNNSYAGMNRIDDADAKLKELNDTTHEKLAKLMEQTEADLGTAADDNEKALENLKTSLKGKIDEVVNKYKTITDNAKTEQGKIEAALSKHVECGKKKQVYNGQSCVQGNPDPLETLPEMYYTMFNNDDSRDSGWLNKRELNFKKEHGDETVIRVTYYDNMRVHGWNNCHAMWEVYFCDKNGNGCQQCSNPGRVNFWKYSHQAGNWWMNDHIGYTAVGYCRQAGNRKLEKGGEYRARVMVHNNRCDIHTGASGQVGSLQIEEVRLQK